MLRSLHDKQPGFTLVEAVIAIGVLAVSVVGVFRLYVGTSLSAGTSLETTSAAAIASRKYEELVAIAQDNWDADSLEVGVHSESVIDSVNNNKYTVYWEVSDFATTNQWQLQALFGQSDSSWRVALRANEESPSSMTADFREVDIVVSYMSAVGKTMPPDDTTCAPEVSVTDCSLRFHGSIVKDAYGASVF